MRQFKIANLIYLVVFVLIGMYGYEFAPFAPNQHGKVLAEYLSIAHFGYFTEMWTIYLIRNRKKALASTPFTQNAFKFYSFVFIGSPLFIALLAVLHYRGVAYGLTSIHAEIFAEEKNATITITGKYKKTKRSKRRRNSPSYKMFPYRVLISGFDVEFPVDGNYYDAVNIGDRYKVVFKKTQFGTKVLFLLPRKRYPPYYEPDNSDGIPGAP
jgi:hypothetical protein